MNRSILEDTVDAGARFRGSRLCTHRGDDALEGVFCTGKVLLIFADFALRMVPYIKGFQRPSRMSIARCAARGRKELLQGRKIGYSIRTSLESG